MARDTKKMKISELSARAGVPVSTIKFYIRKELLPKPTKTAGTQGFYTAKHLDRLQLIQKIQKEGNMSLDKVREITGMIDASEQREKRQNKQGASKQRAEIVQAATALFREKGYEAVTIADIVDAARIGRSTFYKNFGNKKDLFIECIREIIHREGIPESVRDVPETDGFTLFDRSAEAYFRESPVWRDMIKMLRAAAINDPAEFEETLEEALQLKVEMFKKRIRTSVELGFMREVNPTLLAVMLLGIQDYCSEYITKGQFDEPPERILEGVKDILLHGIHKRDGR
jgi:AcrR family transcriptional regulator